MYNICFTGHRPDKLGGPQNSKTIKRKLSSIITDMVCKQPICNKIQFITGGAIGIDQMAFDICYDISNTIDSFYDFELTIAVPFMNQPIQWSQEYRNKYEYQLNTCDNIIYVDTLPEYSVGHMYGEYHPAKMQKRNEWMVDNSDVVVAVWDGGKSGGTWNCIRYARKKHRKMIILDINTMKVTEVQT